MSDAWPRARGALRRAATRARLAMRRRLSRSALARGKSVWLRVRIDAGQGEMRLPAGLSGRGATPGLLELLDALHAAAEDAAVVGLLVELEGGGGGWARRAAIRRAFLALRRAGKRVVVHADALGTSDLFVASAATDLWLAPGGSVHAVGLRVESLFLRGLLDRLDVEADVVRVGTHKSAAEALTRASMSAEQREQTGELLDDLFGTLVAAVAEGRGLTPERVRALIDVGLFPAAAALDAGLIDGTCYPDELEDRIHRLAAAGAEESVPLATFMRWRAAQRGGPPVFREPPRIAYVVAQGAIRRGRGLRGIGTDALRAILRRVRDDDRVRGVVLRIDSPGGDGLASDLLWRELVLLARRKPLVVSMADVAASGGYYLAAAADAIVAEAVTLTGSIGVVGGKLNVEGLYRRLGIGTEAVERGARAGVLSASRGFTPGERSAIRSEMSAVYDTFVCRVAEGRRLAPAAVERVAEGRVWSGLRAQGLGLVDALGGPREALREACRRAGIADVDRVAVDVLPQIPRFAGLRRVVGLVLLSGLDPRGD